MYVEVKCVSKVREKLLAGLPFPGNLKKFMEIYRNSSEFVEIKHNF